MPAAPYRRWFQFRLRTLLILVAVLAVPLAWLAHERNKIRARLDCLESLKKRGAYFEYEEGPPDQPAWLRTLLRDVRSDADLWHIAGLTHLDHTQVTDAELVHLEGLTQIKVLDLKDTPTTPAGRQKLRQALPNTRVYPEP